jgi:threonine dehydratase
MRPTLDDILAAADAIAGRTVTTPVVPAPVLSALLGTEVVIKAELFQVTGAFKIRGVLNRVRSLSDEERRRGVTTVSAGNHALAVARVCGELGVPATVFMPRTASEYKVAGTRAAGASVDLDNDDAATAFRRMGELADATGAVVLHPFDDPAVIAGQGTVGLEIAEQVPGVATVVVPVGGGGLISGIAIALQARCPDARIVAVEPENAATLTAALAAGGPVAIDHVPTLADALAPPSVGEITYEVCAELVDDVVALTEDQLVDGLRVAHRDCKLACETGGAAAIAAVVAGQVPSDGPVVLVVSGGNIAPEALKQLL